MSKTGIRICGIRVISIVSRFLASRKRPMKNNTHTTVNLSVPLHRKLSVLAPKPDVRKLISCGCTLKKVLRMLMFNAIPVGIASRSRCNLSGLRGLAFKRVIGII
jgi:hypothetical protein